MESTQALRWTDAHVAGETDQVTLVRVLNPVTGAVLHSQEVPGTSATVSKPIAGAGATVIVEVSAKRDALASLQAFSLLVSL